LAQSTQPSPTRPVGQPNPQTTLGQHTLFILGDLGARNGLPIRVN